MERILFGRLLGVAAMLGGLHGLTVSTPGSNPVANTGYAVHMRGMNVLLVGSGMMGLSALRRRLLPRSVAWLFILAAPGAVAISLTLLPTSPSGGLWVFSAAWSSSGPPSAGVPGLA
jgi:hypothetical protein